MASRLSQTEWRERRKKVLERDSYTCQRCSKGKSEVDSFHVHHERPLSEGGSNDWENLSTLCSNCHFEEHAEDRRKGTLEDIKDIFIGAEAPVFRTRAIARRFDDLSSNTTPQKLEQLVDRGFLEKGARGVYYRSDLDIDSMNLAGNSGIVVEGSYIKNGEYIGHENRTAQCQYCGQWLYSKGVESKLQRHKKSCSEYNNHAVIKSVKGCNELDFRDEKVARAALEGESIILTESELRELYREHTVMSAEKTLDSRVQGLTQEGPFEVIQSDGSDWSWRLIDQAE